MISRFFKRDKKKPTEAPKKAAVKKQVSAPVKKAAKPPSKTPSQPLVSMNNSKRLLTAEGWKRLMMKRNGNSKKAVKSPKK